MSTGLLYPTFALVGLITVVWATLMFLRVRHVQTNKPSREDFAHDDAVRSYFRPIERPANNLANLFEMPILYFALIPLLYVTRREDSVQVGLAWTFVGLRALHSYIHIGPNRITPRFGAYVGSCVVLLAMWLRFALYVLRAG